jgi:hypothetical protein
VLVLQAKECLAYDIEHYRPKKSAKDADGTGEGYWWLAFDWKNFRTRNAGNRERHLLPLQDGCVRARTVTIGEDPQLLDPVDETDPALLSFNSRAVPCPMRTSPTMGERASQVLIERYNLDSPAHG